MKNKEMILDMLERQNAVSNAIYEVKNYGYHKQQTYMHLLEEVGELTKEIKPMYCKHKKTIEPIDRKKVLEELADVWAYGLLIHYKERVAEELDPNCCHVLSMVDVSTCEMESYVLRNKHKENRIIRMLYGQFNKLLDHWQTYDIIDSLVKITYLLEFTIEDVYKAYIEKNKINYERLKGGY